jgi:hypothetical protein
MVVLQYELNNFVAAIKPNHEGLRILEKVLHTSNGL